MRKEMVCQKQGWKMYFENPRIRAQSKRPQTTTITVAADKEQQQWRVVFILDIDQPAKSEKPFWQPTRIRRKLIRDYAFPTSQTSLQ